MRGAIPASRGIPDPVLTPPDDEDDDLTEEERTEQERQRGEDKAFDDTLWSE